MDHCGGKEGAGIENASISATCSVREGPGKTIVTNVPASGLPMESAHRNENGPVVAGTCKLTSSTPQLADVAEL